MSGTVKGNTLHGNAIPTADYLTDRDPATLRWAGALTQKEAELLERADKIGSGNKNGIVEAKEVDAMFDPGVRATLFPEERVLLDGMWKKFEVTDAAYTPVNVPFEAKGLPGGSTTASPDKSHPIAQLPAELQQTARRIQLTFNKDASPPTIQYADLAKALEPGHVERYTDQEVAQIHKLQSFFLEHVLVRKIVSPRLEIPSLGQHEVDLPAPAGMKATLVLKDELKLSQRRRARNNDTSKVFLDYQRTEELTYTREALALKLKVPAGHKLLVHTETGVQQFGAGTAVPKPVVGPYLLELFDASGNKTDASFTLSEPNAKLDLTQEHLHKPVVLASGEVVNAQLDRFNDEVKSATPYTSQYTSYTTSHVQEAQWSFVKGAPDHRGSVQQAEATFALPPGLLREGVYESKLPLDSNDHGQSPPSELDIRLVRSPGDLYTLKVGSQELNLPPTWAFSTHALTMGVCPKGGEVNTVTFYPETGRLTLGLKIEGKRFYYDGFVKPEDLQLT